MGAADSRSRSVSYGLDEQDNVTVIHGVKVTDTTTTSALQTQNNNHDLCDTTVPL